MRQRRSGLTHGTSARQDAPLLEHSDEILMLKTAEGDHQAFRHLLERHLGWVVAFATRVLGSHAAGEDIAQETFLRLWTHAAQWKPTARLRTWLYRVALNLCLDKRTRARDVALDEIAEPCDPSASVLARMQAQDIGRHVNAALADLPVQQRVAITLCHYQGLRNTEASQVMGVSVEALESLLARGRRTLRTRLRALLPDLLGDE